ncbi:MAG: NAD(P)H-binding protein [Candidatus Nanohaloarchaea archaeon]|nr:NAD(P)H-binding protein [Candidatus Nanohaloarchaea archaeon]
MKLAIFGAAGRTGQELVDQALERGHDVRAFDLDTLSLSHHERLELIDGDIHDQEAVRNAIQGCDAVVSGLGITGSQSDVLTAWAENIVPAMEEEGIKRLVSLTGAGVRVKKDRPPRLVGRLIHLALKLVAGHVLEDGRRHVEVIRESELNWTIVRAPRLGSGEKRGDYRTGYLRPSHEAVMRADVAEFMLDLVEDDEKYSQELPIIRY